MGTMHTIHRDSMAAGLLAGCPRCEELQAQGYEDWATRTPVHTIAADLRHLLDNHANYRDMPWDEAVREMGWQHGRDAYWGMSWVWQPEEIAHALAEFWTAAAAREYLDEYKRAVGIGEGER
jgi:hypothetical protein